MNSRTPSDSLPGPDAAVGPLVVSEGIVSGVNPPDPSSGSPSFASLEGARYAMGDTLRFAREMDLAKMEPRGDLSSTGYALAHPGEEYLVLQPDESAGPFSVRPTPTRSGGIASAAARRKTPAR